MHDAIFAFGWADFFGGFATNAVYGVISGLVMGWAVRLIGAPRASNASPKPQKAPKAKKLNGSRWSESHWIELRYWIGFLLLGIVAVTLLSVSVQNERGDRPRLKTEAGAVTFGTTPEDPTSLIIICSMTIYNAGSPTTVRDWRLFIKLADGSVLYPKTIALPLPGVTSQGHNHLTFKPKFEESDWLIAKVGTKEIPRGGSASGIAVFNIQGYGTNIVFQPGSVLSVVLKDVEDQAYTCDFFSPQQK